ncbi:IS256 family transposase, partial [Ornithinibacillus sp. L9]|nr:IS256 family transposase [Ornithinibacillus caprae]
TKKGAFPNENALLKVLYLRTKELENKWEGGHIQQWAMVMNQLKFYPILKLTLLQKSFKSS